MKDYFDHFGDVFQELKEIYDSLPRSSTQRKKIKEFTKKLASFRGEWPNLDAVWPEAIDDVFSGFYHPVSTVGNSARQE